MGILRSGWRGEEVNQREIRGWDLWFVILGGSRIKSFSIFAFQQKSTESKRMLKKQEYNEAYWKSILAMG